MYTLETLKQAKFSSNGETGDPFMGELILKGIIGTFNRTPQLTS